ncbi:MAG: PAS domain S-box protein [bacterium]|nr:PAS domain S-box protein [bacterium]
MGRVRILIVEETATTTGELRAELDRLGYDVAGVAATADEAAALAASRRPDLLLFAPPANGTPGPGKAALDMGRDLGLPVLFLTTADGHAYDVLPPETGAFAFAPTSSPPCGLRAGIESALRAPSENTIPCPTREDDSGRAPAAGESDAAIAESEERFRYLSEAAFEAIIVHEEGRLLEANRAYYDLFGYTEEELRDIDAMQKTIVTESLIGARQNVTDGVTGPYGITCVRKDGTRFPAEVRARNTTYRGRPARVAAIRDISEQTRADAILRRREAIMAAGAFAADRLLRGGAWEDSVPEILARLGEATRVDSVYVFQNHRSEDGVLLATERFHWLRGAGPDSRREGFPPTDVPWLASGFARWKQVLESGGTVLGHVKDLPPDEAASPLLQGIRSAAAVPITVGGVWWGFLGLDVWEDHWEWSQVEVDALRAVASTLGAAIQRVEAEELLRAQQEDLAFILDSVPAYIFYRDVEGRYLRVNRALTDVTGIPEDQWIGRTPDELFPDLGRRCREQDDTVIRTGVSSRGVQEPIQTKDEVRWALTDRMPYRDWDDRIIGIIGMSVDISELKRAEEQIRALTQQLLKAQETERHRIARDLHDHVAQDLSTLKIACDMLFDGDERFPDETMQRMRRMSDLLRDAIAGVRDMAYGLRPPGLDELGIVRTVYEYCQEFAQRSGLEVHFSSAGLDDLQLDPETGINLYRLVQEALNNVRKHARARRVTIRLVASFPDIILRIEDDGRGFEPKGRRVKALNEKRMGLRSMEERATLLDGRMTVQSRPDSGTMIVIEVPYKERRRDSKEKRTDY